MRAIKKRTLTGTRIQEPAEYEFRHRKLARQAAAEGMVLLKNEKQLLPLEEGKKLALFGAGAVQTIKGGTGSGDVNERESISVYEGLVNAGYQITTEEWLKEYKEIYSQSRSWMNIRISMV